MNPGKRADLLIKKGAVLFQVKEPEYSLLKNLTMQESAAPKYMLKSSVMVQPVTRIILSPHVLTAKAQDAAWNFALKTQGLLWKK